MNLGSIGMVGSTSATILTSSHPHSHDTEFLEFRVLDELLPSLYFPSHSPVIAVGAIPYLQTMPRKYQQSGKTNNES